jgi:hypothetical protein
MKLQFCNLSADERQCVVLDERLVSNLPCTRFMTLSGTIWPKSRGDRCELEGLVRPFPPVRSPTLALLSIGTLTFLLSTLPRKSNIHRYSVRG